MFFIKPSTITILGDTNGEPTDQLLQEEEEPRPHLSFWGRFKQKARCALGALKSALTFIQETVVPIVISISGLVSALRPQKSGTRMCYVCA